MFTKAARRRALNVVYRATTESIQLKRGVFVILAIYLSAALTLRGEIANATVALIFVGLGTLALGITTLAEWAGRKLLQNAYDEFAAQFQILVTSYRNDEQRLTNAVWQLEDDWAMNGAFMRIVTPNRSPLMVFAFINQLTDLKDLQLLLERLQGLSEAYINTDRRPQIKLFTRVGPGLVHEAGMEEEIDAIIKVTRGEWWFTTSMPFPSKCNVFTHWGSIISGPEHFYGWVSLELCQPIHTCIANCVDRIVENATVRIVSRVQLQNLGSLDEKLNHSHNRAFQTDGFWFGRSTKLIGSEGLLKIGDARDIRPHQVYENLSYWNLAQDILRHPCSITSIWPLRGDSLNYIMSEEIGKWQREVLRHVNRTDRPGTAERYLLVEVDEDRTGTLNVHNDEITISINGTPRTIEYRALVEAVIGKCFWGALWNTNRFTLYIVPIRRKTEEDLLWHEYQSFFEHARGLSRAQTTNIRRRSFLIDWVMFERHDGDYPIRLIQFDKLEEFGRGKLLSHKYAPLKRRTDHCDQHTKCTTCGVIDEEIDYPFCCISLAAKEIPEPYRAKIFDRTTHPFGLNGIAANGIGFYRRDWNNILDDLNRQ